MPRHLPRAAYIAHDIAGGLVVLINQSAHKRAARARQRIARTTTSSINMLARRADQARAATSA